MKTRHAYLSVFLLSALASTAAWAVRDPFWPIGYTPPPPPSPVTETLPSEPTVKPPPPKPAPPAVKPVTDADWAKARKALPVSGFTKSVRPDTQETKILVMINRRSYQVGDKVPFVHDDIRFQWRIEAITEKDLTLVPLQAVRITPKPRDLNSNL
jgi:hypothetical protein